MAYDEVTAQLVCENEKMKAALRQIANFDGWSFSDRQTIYQMRLIAKTALGDALSADPESAALLDEAHKIMQALMSKSDIAFDRNAEFAAVAAWWTKAQGGIPLIQPMEALAASADPESAVVGAATNQISSPKFPEGWKLVPIEPTREMIDAWSKADDAAFVDGSSHGLGYCDAWDIGIATAPTLPHPALDRANAGERESEGMPVHFPAGDWTEDASHENGNYQCLCVYCRRLFIGHKRRVVCKVCAADPARARTDGPTEPCICKGFEVPKCARDCEAAPQHNPIDELECVCGATWEKSAHGWDMVAVPHPPAIAADPERREGAEGVGGDDGR